MARIEIARIDLGGWCARGHTAARELKRRLGHAPSEMARRSEICLRRSDARALVGIGLRTRAKPETESIQILL